MKYGSPVAHAIYGCDNVPEDAWLNYAYALLTIAGADGRVTQAEMKWLFNDFVDIVNGGQKFKTALHEFDYNNADLDELLDKISLDIPINYKRALVYDAIKMSRADDVFADTEKEAVEKTAAILKVPIYLARTIEGLVSTEKSLEATRKSIFEVDKLSSSVLQNVFDSDTFRETNVSVKHTYGIGKTTDEVQLYYGYALMAVTGADGRVSPEEQEWYKEVYAADEKIPPYIVDRVLSCDYTNLDLETILNHLKADISINFKRTLLYNSIKMAHADLEYANEERAAVSKTARLLNVDLNIAHTIEYMIDTENKVALMRKKLFEV